MRQVGCLVYRAVCDRRALVQVKRCNEMARRLRFFYEQVTAADIPKQSANMMDTERSPVQLEELEVRCRLMQQLFGGNDLCGYAPTSYRYTG
jgi:hypothetical protein